MINKSFALLFYNLDASSIVFLLKYMDNEYTMSFKYVQLLFTVRNVSITFFFMIFS